MSNELEVVEDGSTKRVVEINGIKMEIDLRNATVIENYRVGDNVKILIKQYGDTYATYPGVIVAFDQFEELPTICVMYLVASYSEAELKMAYINSKSEGIEITKAHKNDFQYDHAKVQQLLQRAIVAKEVELKNAQHKLEYFENAFGTYFVDFLKTNETPTNEDIPF
ncbi:hypothetical protein LCGC14_2869150 [marine sediment metagenome]|uniref:Uncharacterized protein n=1 Tax=marine sediment metagenome TaxID=412755 RepID=A0A0F8YQ83_9ZZZZ